MDVLIQKEQTHIGVITLNRPEVRNALNDQMITQLQQGIANLVADSAIRIIFIKANGKHFSAGADLNWMQQSVNLTTEENRQDALQLSNMLSALFHCPKPVIIAAHGASYGGALGLLACADIVFTTPNSQFCFSEVKLGLVPAVISPYVIYAIGARQANRLFLSAERFNSELAYHIDLVHHIVEEADLQDTAMAACATMIQHGPQATQACKQMLKSLHPIDDGDPHHQALTQSGLTIKANKSPSQYTVELIAALRTSDEGQEGLSAFLEKRRANWI